MDTLNGKRVLVGSGNPVKSKSIKLAFEQMFGRSPEIFTLGVESAVSDQPMTDAETLKGARHRAEAARAAQSNHDLYVGIEGGIEEHDTGMLAFAWIVILGNDQVGAARTATFPIPYPIAKLVRDGIELGEANDIVFGVKDSKHERGAVGLLTDAVIDRTSLYQHAASLALIPFLKPNLFA